jgi:hypothetical protein
LAAASGNIRAIVRQVAGNRRAAYRQQPGNRWQLPGNIWQLEGNRVERQYIVFIEFIHNPDRLPQIARRPALRHAGQLGFILQSIHIVNKMQQ